MKLRRIPLNFVTIHRNGTPSIFFPATAWMPCGNASEMRGTFELFGWMTDLEVAVGYQTANVENSPDTAVAVGSFATANGMAFPTAFTSIASNTEQKQIFRLGYIGKNTSTSNQTFAYAGGYVDLLERD